MHKVLARQLRSLGLPSDAGVLNAAAWKAFLERVERAYMAADDDRYTLERSLTLASEEMNALHDRLAAERDKLQALVACLGDGLVVIDRQGNVEFVNEEGERILGRSGVTMIGQPLIGVVGGNASSNSAGNSARLSRLRACVGEWLACRDNDARFWNANGTWIPVELTFNPILHGEDVVGGAIIFHDVSARHALEQAIRESEGRLRAMFESAAAGILRLDPSGRILDANTAASELFGLSGPDLEGRVLRGLFESEPPASLRQPPPSARGAQNDEREHRLARQDGSVAWVRATENWVRAESGDVGFGTVILEDITTRKHLECSLRHAQKLESVGRLASGIAHEINTPVQFVSDNVHFLREAFDAISNMTARYEAALAGAPADVVEEAVRAAEDADWPYLRIEVPKAILQTLDGLGRVATIVKSMKAFAHVDHGVQVETDINAALESTLAVAAHEFKVIARVERCFGEIPQVKCYPGDLNQVFLNLLVNASHAIGDVVKDSMEMGRITLATRCDERDVVISISDTGAGIPEDVRPRLFEPFFTTKPVGQGTGQGLALARSIVVDKHRGSLTYDTVDGEGTTFHIRLPIAGVSAAPERAA